MAVGATTEAGREVVGVTKRISTMRGFFVIRDDVKVGRRRGLRDGMRMRRGLVRK